MLNLFNFELIYLLNLLRFHQITKLIIKDMDLHKLINYHIIFYIIFIKGII